MEKKWCVREGAFRKDDGLWWLDKERTDAKEKSGTPMAVALKNGDISRVIDVKLDGLSGPTGKRRIF